MPGRPLKPCSIPGCPEFEVPGKGRCVKHAFNPWAGSMRRARPPSDWPARWRQVLKRDDYTCQECGAHANQVDHIVAGDDHSMENLQSLCWGCHKTKSAREGNRASRTDVGEGGLGDGAPAMDLGTDSRSAAAKRIPRRAAPAPVHRGAGWAGRA